MMEPDALPRCREICFNAEKIDTLRKQLPAKNELAEKARCHKALGHPSRLAIVNLLERETCCVCDLASILDMPVSTVSQHLRVLASAELLESHQQGKLVFYSLIQPAIVEMH
ncbi:MAG TPA: metalloregulator ArsR/SmtB family transcription factor [Pontiella sp.]